MDKPEPEWSSESDTVVPTGATYVDNRGPAQFAGHFVFCNNSVGLRVFTGGTPHAELANGPDRCRLDVKEGPDHALYFSDESNIYRLA
jgi:hypothetical protein